MITVKYNGTLGNNLWQYAVARIFAEERGLAFSAPSLKNFPQAAQKIRGKKYILPRFIFDHQTNYIETRKIVDPTTVPWFMNNTDWTLFEKGVGETLESNEKLILNSIKQ